MTTPVVTTPATSLRERKKLATRRQLRAAALHLVSEYGMANVTVEDIADAYTQAWRLGIKALAIYRDGSKTAQALRTDAQQGEPAAKVDVDALVERAWRGLAAEEIYPLLPEDTAEETLDSHIGDAWGFASAARQANTQTGQPCC